MREEQAYRDPTFDYVAAKEAREQRARLRASAGVIVPTVREIRVRQMVRRAQLVMVMRRAA